MNQSDVGDLLALKWALYPHLFAQSYSPKWKPYPYLVKISKLITEKILEGGGRLIITLPPRHGKSELISKYTPAWFLSRFPERNVILASYESDFAAHWGRQVRNILNEGVFGEARLSEDSTAAYRFNLRQGGAMITAGFGGAITGRGGDVLVVDDPVKNWADAKSPTKQKSTLEWFHSTFYTRAESHSTIIILQTRWDENDLAGSLDPDEWTLINFPAIAMADDPLGRKEGEALCPARYSAKTLLNIKANIGSEMFNSIYQGNPLPPSGVKFRREWIRFYKRDDIYPNRINTNPFDQLIFSWDLAFDGDVGSDYSVGQVWATKGDKFYLLGQRRERAKFIRQKELVISLKGEWPSYIACLIEKAANGAALIDAVQEDLSGIIEIKPTESKEVRADYVTGLWEGGRVLIPDPTEEPWIEGFIDELVKFPRSKHDDQVDAMTQALRYLSGQREPRLRIINSDFETEDGD